MAAPEAAKVSLLLPDVPLRSLDALSSGPTSPDHSTVAEVRALLAKYDLAAKMPPSVRAFFEREDLPESPGNKGWRAAFLSQACREARLLPARRVTAAAIMSGEDDAFRDSVFEILLSSHDLAENARALAAEGRLLRAVDNSCDDWDYADAARYLLERFHALRANHPRLCLISVGEVTVTWTARPAPAAATSSLSWPARWNWKVSRRAADRAQRRLRRHRRQYAGRPGPSPILPPCPAPTPSDST